MPPPGIPTGGQTPAPDPAPVPTPDAKAPAPVFAGTVLVKIYSDLIATGNENGQINGVDPAKMGRIQEAVKGISGVSGVSVSSTTGILEAGYSGPYNNVEDIEKAVARLGVHCTLISPVIVKFRPYNQDNEAKVTSALQSVSGSIGVIKDSGNFCLYLPLESLTINGILDSCKNAGYPGTIISHDYYELSFTKAGDVAKLEKELRDTKFILKSQVDTTGNKVTVTVVRGRCSKAQVKKLTDSCGFDCK